MADNWRKKLESIGKREPDEASKRILADIEANKKRNKELADKRTRDAVESVLNQGAKEKKNESKSTDNSPKKASRSAEKTPKSSKTSPNTSTTLRTQKGGSMTAETTTKESQNKASREKEIEKTLNNPTSRSDTVEKKETSSKQQSKGRVTGTQQAEKIRQALKSSYHGGAEWRRGVKRVVTSPLRLVKKVGKAAYKTMEKQNKKKKGSSYGSPYQLKI